MGENFVDKGKTPTASSGVINLPAPDVEAVHVLRYRQLQEEFEAREKKLVAQLDEKQELFQKKLEEVLAEQERRLAEELHAKHMAEYRRLELAAADREHTLLEKLGVARRLLTMVSLGFIILVALVLYSRIGLRPSAQPVPLPPKVSDETAAPEVVAALLPHLSAPDVVVTRPSISTVGEGSPKTAGAKKKAGNGGNFLRGSM
jgi:hypothetical protein